MIHYLLLGFEEVEEGRALEENQREAMHNSDVCRKVISIPTSNKVHPTINSITLPLHQENGMDPLDSSSGTNTIEIQP